MKMLTLESREKVLVVTLNRNVQNTIDDALAGELEGALAQAERSDMALLHLRTATAHFCGGADPARVAHWLAEGGGEGLRSDGDTWDGLFRRIEESPVTVFAEMKGNALGAGLGLALACDLRMMSATSRIGVPEVKVGLLPAGRTVERLVALAGTGVAQRLLLGGDIIDGLEAHRLGLAHWMVPDEDLEARAAALVDRIARQSPLALREAKSLLAATRRHSPDGAADVEAAAFDRLIHSDEPRARIRALLGRFSRAG
jgi:enoyl-CoA hydratase